MNRAAREVESRAEDVAEHPAFRALARGGFVMSGLVHILIGWIAMRMAFGGSGGSGSGGSGGGSADQSGALSSIAAAPGGAILLWIGGIAMIALAVLLAIQAWADARSGGESRKRLTRTVSDGAKAVVYAALAFTSIRFAVGQGSSSGQQTESATSTLLGGPFGRVLVVILGLVVLGVGIGLVYIGASRKFTEHIERSGGRNVGRAVVITGIVGYIAKGIALMAVGGLFAWAGIGADPEKATGLDGAMRTIAQAPAGGVLLCVVGVGLMLYGIFSILRSRYGTVS